MFSRFSLLQRYARYFCTASNGKGHGIHSPFLYHFVTKVLNDRQNFPEYNTIENLRNQLLKNNTPLTIEDFGAGSSISKSNIRTVASIARNAAKSKKFGQLLFRIVKQYQPDTIIELGTSLGITSAYLSLANPAAKVITMEGASAVAAAAVKNFTEVGIKNITLQPGNFNDTLPGILEKMSTVDFAFVDGNHRQEPTENYFYQLLEKINNQSILIFDDIHWSREMENAWNTIKMDEAVTCTIDLFFIGLVLFRPEFHEKQHFTIRY